MYCSNVREAEVVRGVYVLLLLLHCCQDVGRVLALLCVTYVMKGVSEDGLFAFNLALPDR